MIFKTKALIILLVFIVEFQKSETAPVKPRKDLQADEEAMKIALESTGELIAEPELVEKIKSDLELIRYLDQSLAKRIHTGKWKPGEIVARQVTQDQLKEVEASEFKPVKSISKNSGNTILVFAKPYHPEQLARLLKLRFGFDSKPNMIENKEGKGDQILYRHELSTYYWNSINGKDCEKGCLAQYAVSVDETPNYDSNFGLNFLHS